jgi:hypothetical protein
MAWIPSQIGPRARRVLEVGVVAGCLILTLAMVAEPLPMGNEGVYLITAARTWNGDLLAGDWTFGHPSAEHWVFNHAIGWLTLPLDLDTYAWLGRFLSWLALFWACLQLGRALGLATGWAATAVVLTVACNQAVLADGVLFSGFEAKSVAWPLSIFAIADAVRGRTWRASILGALGFAFHPGLGSWIVPALVVAFYRQQLPVRALLARIGVMAAIAAPAALAIVLSGTAAGASTDDWIYLITVRLAHHSDPFSWPLRAYVTAGLLFGFGWRLTRVATDSPALRTLFTVEASLAAFTVLGFLVRAAGGIALLRFFTFKVFGVAVLLFFALRLGWLLQRGFPPGARALAALAIVAALSLPNPLTNAVELSRRNLTELTESERASDAQRCFTWIRDNTPPDAVVLAPPSAEGAFYVSRRPQVVSWKALPYEAVGEWRARLRDVLGGEEPPYPSFARNYPFMRERYARLTYDDLDRIAARYGAVYFVSPTRYERLPVAHACGALTVYDLRPLTRSLGSP